MAEGLLRHLYGDRYEVSSAGTDPANVNPLALKVMGERGVDISNQQSKSLDPYIKNDFDYVITLCDRVRESCPLFSGGKQMLHQNFRDPAEGDGAENEILAVFRSVRNEIEEWIKRTFA